MHGVCTLQNLVAAGNGRLSQAFVAPIFYLTVMMVREMSDIGFVISTHAAMLVYAGKLRKLPAFLRGRAATHFYSLTSAQCESYASLSEVLERLFALRLNRRKIIGNLNRDAFVLVTILQCSLGVRGTTC